MAKNQAAVELGRRRQSSRTRAERSAHGRLMALARWGNRPSLEPKASSLKESLTRVREIPGSWMEGFIRREVEKTGCSIAEARERGIRNWEEH